MTRHQQHERHLQQEWLDALGQVDTVETYLWRLPGAWGRIGEALR